MKKSYYISAAGYTPTEFFDSLAAARKALNEFRAQDKKYLKQRGFTEIKMGTDCYKIMIGNKHSTAMFSSYAIVSK